MNNLDKKIQYPYVLDYKPKLFFNWILYQLFKRVSLEEDMKEALKQMQRKGTVVYASKYQGLLDYVLYHYSYRRRRLPYPKIAFDLNIALVLPLNRLAKITGSLISSFFRYGRIPSPYETGFYQNAILRRTPALISLIDPKSFIRSFIHSEKDHLHFLLETQKEMDLPIFIVPHLILLQHDPEKDYKSLGNIIFGYRDHAGIFMKIALFFRNYCRAFIDFGAPLNLKTYLEAQPPSRPIKEMTAEIRQMLIERIDGQKRVILGPIMKSRQQLKEMVLTDQMILEQIERMSSGNGEKQRKLRKKAGEYFDEIAADLNIIYVQFFRKALKWLWKKLYDGIDVDPVGSAKVRKWARKGTLIYVPSHKSHMDYLVLNDALYEHHMHIPRIAAGQNLTFWPMGYIFRKCGAFFIRRTFKGAKLYSEVFSRYIKVLLEEEHPIEFYMEGGRSRNGKLAFPKKGFLSILLQAYQEGFSKDLIFVPTSIIYDRIIEESTYLKEINGGVKEKENIRQVIRARGLLKKRYGKIYIRFNEPFSLNDYLSKTSGEPRNVPRELAFHLVKAINEVSLVTPLSLVATAILTTHRRGFHPSRLIETVSVLLEFLKRDDVLLADSLSDPMKAIHETISLLISWKVVDLMEDTPGDEEIFYYVEDEKTLELEYYKNSIIHFFIYHSLVAVSLLAGKDDVKKTESILSDYHFLKDLFQNEFVFETNDDLQKRITSILEYFQDSGFLLPSAGGSGYTITKPGFDNLIIWAGLAKTFLESYWIAAKAISREKDGKARGQNLLKTMSYLGKRYHKMGLIDHIGALSQINFRNAMDFIRKNILNTNQNTEHDDTYPPDNLLRFISRLYELSHFGHYK